MDVKKVSDAVTSYFTEVLHKPVKGHFPGQTFGVTTVQPDEKGWRVVIEVVDDPGMGMDPVLGIYEVLLDKNMNITAYERRSMRRSSDVSSEKATVPREIA